MMYQCHNIDEWCMFICMLPCRWSQALHANTILHNMQVLTLSTLLCRCDLFHMLNSFVGLIVCYRSMTWNYIHYKSKLHSMHAVDLWYIFVSISTHIAHITTWQCAWYTYLLLIYNTWSPAVFRSPMLTCTASITHIFYRSCMPTCYQSMVLI